MKTLKEIICIVAISVVLGLLVNMFHPEPAVLSWERPLPLMNKSDGMEIGTDPAIISIDQLKDLIEKGNVLIIDARLPEEYNVGHIPDAINVSFDLLGEHVQKILQEPRDRALVTYCDGPPCEKSVVLATELKSLEFTKVYVFYDGLEDWIGNGNRVTEEAE